MRNRDLEAGVEKARRKLANVFFFLFKSTMCHVFTSWSRSFENPTNYSTNLAFTRCSDVDICCHNGWHCGFDVTRVRCQNNFTIRTFFSIEGIACVVLILYIWNDRELLRPYEEPRQNLSFFGLINFVSSFAEIVGYLGIKLTVFQSVIGRSHQVTVSTIIKSNLLKFTKL